MAGPVHKSTPGNGEPHAIPPSPAFVGRVVSAASIVIGLVLLVMALWSAREVLLLLFGGVLFAVLLRFGAGELCRHTPLGERTSLAAVLGAVLALAALAAWLVGPSIAQETAELRSGLGESLDGLRAQVEDTTVGGFMLDRLPQLEQQDYNDVWSRIGGMSATAFGALGAVLIVLFVGIFFAFNPGLYINGLLRLLPRPSRPRALEVLERVTVTLRWWLLGQVISMIFLWLSTWLLLWLIGVPMAFILALLTGLLTFVPYLGPLIAVVPIALVAFADGASTGLMALVGYLIIQNLEGNLLMPLVFQKLVRIPAALSVAAQVLMATLIGLIGVVLATPLLAAAMVAVRMLYVEDVLGDSLDEPPVPERAGHARDCPPTDGSG